MGENIRGKWRGRKYARIRDGGKDGRKEETSEEEIIINTYKMKNGIKFIMKTAWKFEKPLSDGKMWEKSKTNISDGFSLEMEVGIKIKYPNEIPSLRVSFFSSAENFRPWRHLWKRFGNGIMNFGTDMSFSGRNSFSVLMAFASFSSPFIKWLHKNKHR